MKIVVINGSQREKSFTRKLTDYLTHYLKEKNHNFDYIDLVTDKVENFRGFDVEYGKETKGIIEAVESADVIFIGTPIYNAVFSSGIKNIFEHLNYKGMNNPVAGFIIKGGGMKSSLLVKSQLDAMTDYFDIVSNPSSVISTGGDFDENGNLTSEDIKKRLRDLAESTIALRK